MSKDISIPDPDSIPLPEEPSSSVRLSPSPPSSPQQRKRQRVEQKTNQHEQRQQYHVAPQALPLSPSPPPPEEVPLPPSLGEEEMMAIMGFSSFNTTKGKKVPGNDVGAIHVVKKRKYRQYMNRTGGFNRPLDKTA